jgi:ACS family hexuronate transporter-like MFS transporter
VTLLFLTAVMNNLDRQTLSVLAPTLKERLGITSVQYSYVVSAFLAAYTIGYLFAGSIIDLVGVKVALAVALAFWSVVNGLHAMATGWLALVGMRFLLGLGECFNSPAALKALAEWVPSRERGLCVAIYNNGFVVGSILAPPLVSAITLHFGWQWSFMVTGALGFVVLALWMRYYDAPEKSRFLRAEERAHILSQRDPVAPKSGATPTLWTLLRHPVFVAFFVSRFLTDPFSYFFNFWLPDYFQNARGFSLAMLGAVGWLPFLLADIGGPAGGAWSDWLVRRGWDPRRARLALMLAAAVVMPLGVAAVRVDSVWVALAILSLMFGGQMCWMVNQLAVLAEYFPRHLVATVISLSAVGGGIGGVLATLLIGRAVQHYGYVPVFTGMSALHLTAFAFIVWMLRRSGSKYVT